MSEALKWFGVVGTSFTIFSNAGTFIDFSKFVQLWTDQWRQLITQLVNFFVQWFDIEVDESTAVIVFSVVPFFMGISVVVQSGISANSGGRPPLPAR
ncbi:hypothetical protein [Roseibium sp.]|uniref:hypothetical protein n=1 Tax=Roseibium sp. TaxID=1936156 RepID=UPI003B509ACA